MVADLLPLGRELKDVLDVRPYTNVLCPVPLFNLANVLVRYGHCLIRQSQESLKDMGKAYTETKEGKKCNEKARSTYYSP